MLNYILQMVFSAIGQLILAGGGAAVVASLLMKTLGERWLNSKFEQQLQSRQHVQERDIEQLRFKINSMFDRKTKLHQREFEIVPEAWSKLIDAHSEVANFTSALQQYPDLNSTTKAKLDEFLAESNLHSWQKAELLLERDKSKYYRDAIFYQRLGMCQSAYSALHVFVSKNAIFFPDKMKADFNRLSDLIWNALVEHETNKEVVVREKTERKLLDTEGKKLLSEIESSVRNQLWEDAELK